jgi:hypothetical protein
MQCLMIETKDNRKFFTYEENLESLSEFSKVFNTTISIVEIKTSNCILTLKELASVICEANYQKPSTQYEVIKSFKKTRKNILTTANTIQNYILAKFKQNEVVSLRELKLLFPSQSCAALCNHTKRAGKILQNQGFSINKIGAGRYKAHTL